jgi:hypothetical protein
MNTPHKNHSSSDPTTGTPPGSLRQNLCALLGCPIPPAHPTLEKQAKELLDRRKYTTKLPALDELVESFDFSHDNVEKKIQNYKAAGRFLLFAIPIVSALLAFVANVTDDARLHPPVSWLQGSVPSLSLSLALLTVINSIVKPSVRFERCCRIGVDLFHWRCTFLEGLEKLHPVDEKTLVEFLAKERKEFRKLQLADISLALPDHS